MNQQNQQNQVEHPRGWRKLMAKRWMYPAMYVIVAGLMLVMMWAYQSKVEQSISNQPAVPTGGEAKQPPTQQPLSDQQEMAEGTKDETMIWPFSENRETMMEIVKPFFEKDAPVHVREQALVEYEQTFTPHNGVDFARKDKQSFTVRSALSGKVTRVEKHPIFGQTIEMKHPNELVTVYQSLGDVLVTMNQQVSQGEAIGKSGQNEFEKDLGVHLHFEVRQQGNAINPEHWIPKQD
jgi:stage II sporulation protein Q